MKIIPNKDQRKMMGALMAAGLSLSSVISSVFLIGPREGYSTKTYLDPVGIVTSCYGHTDPSLRLGQTFTHFECLNQLAKDAGEAEKDVDAVIKVPLNVYQKAALISFDYNFGRTKFASSTMAKRFNQGNYEGGCNELMKWKYAGKKMLPGLEKSRRAELAFCLGNVEVDLGN